MVRLRASFIPSILDNHVLESDLWQVDVFTGPHDSRITPYGYLNMETTRYGLAPVYRN